MRYQMWVFFAAEEEEPFVTVMTLEEGAPMCHVCLRTWIASPAFDWTERF